MPSLLLRSLRGKLLLFSLLLVVVPGVVFALIALANTRRALERAVGLQLVEVARDSATAIEAALAEERKNVRAWARQEVMRDIIIGDLDKRIARFLSSERESDTRYLDLLCTDVGGRTVAASDPALLGKRFADSRWHRAALQGKTVLAGPSFGPERGHAVLMIAAPIRDPEQRDRVIGVFRATYDWRAVAAITSRIQHHLQPLGIVVDILILDEHGTVMSGTSAGPRAGQNLRAAGWRSAEPQPQGEPPGYLIEPAAAVLVGYAHMKVVRSGWSALVMQPLASAFAPVERMETRLLLALAGVLLAALAVAALLAERMSRPLRELTRATREIALAGETRRPVVVRSRDEIGQLAAAFNSMAGELKRAQDDLLAAAKFAFVGEVAAGVAHEVRTPLGILRSSAQILARSLARDGERSAENTELIEMIISEVDRLDRVVAGLLELARPREPMIEQAPLEPTIARAVDFASGQALEKGIAIRRDFAPGQPLARCDPEQIYQVALNLIVNALQILPPGGEITVRTGPASNGHVTFEVSDNGPGIPTELRERIFTPFFTMRKGGTGLGLALVQQVVQAHQGSVSVESEVGHGTTFRVELPAAPGHEP